MAAKLLEKQLRELMKDPVEGVAFGLWNETNLFEWRIWVEGPPDCFFTGGVFELKMTFPFDYPMNPPALQFVSEFWHPNVYKDGHVCISILHPPGEDVMSGELASERWLPTQSVSSIILSVISMLSAPNFSSPANVDASVEWRNSPDVYEEKVKYIIEKANSLKPKDLMIPHPESDPTQRQRAVEHLKVVNSTLDNDEILYDEREADDADEGESASEAESTESEDSEKTDDRPKEDKDHEKQEEAREEKEEPEVMEKAKATAEQTPETPAHADEVAEASTTDTITPDAKHASTEQPAPSGGHKKKNGRAKKSCCIQ
eukprot:TRINITY_DN2302_c0_g1_i1.p1 TRINITY_DN2302_c0_g1~~TRINITY_DN2302_c0_g1_i1.p1  ORF type:complete len:316 (-),score=83.95 TRINITY_DN2302_c0_g1_i1:638-1585(-)